MNKNLSCEPAPSTKGVNGGNNKNALDKLGIKKKKNNMKRNTRYSLVLIITRIKMHSIHSSLTFNNVSSGRKFISTSPNIAFEDSSAFAACSAPCNNLVT